MTDAHEPDIEKIIAENARAGAREAKIKFTDRRLFWIFVTLVALLAVAAWYAQASTNGLQHRIEKRLCVVLVPLLPKNPHEVPTTGYGTRVLHGVQVGAHENHCAVPPLPKAH